MSLPTHQAYIHSGDWDEETRRHPAMKWMEDYTRNLNAHGGWDKPSSDWHSSDFTLVKSDGSTYTGAGGECFEQVKGMYAPFTKEYHEPSFIVCWETPNGKGWQAIAQAHFFADCQGEAKSGEKKVKDDQGQEWDVKIPGAFNFVYVKKEGAAHGDIELQRAEIMVDSLPAVQILMARGVKM